MKTEGMLSLLIAENGKTEYIEFNPLDRPDLYEKWKTLVEAAARMQDLYPEDF